MTQDDLKIWCELHDCYVYSQKDTDFGLQIIMRSNKDRKLMAILFEPKNGKYRAASVCHICNTLKIEVPEYGMSMQDQINIARSQCENK